MADNEITIRVTSENRTKAGFDSARADAAQAGDEAGQAYSRSFTARIAGAMLGGGGGGGGLVGAAGGAGGGLFGAAGGAAPFLASPQGLAAAAAGVVLSSPLIVSLLGGLVGAGGALGAFRIASNANTQMTALQTAVAAAQKALETAQEVQRQHPGAANAEDVLTAQRNLTQATQAATAFQQQHAAALGLSAAGQNFSSTVASVFSGALQANARREVAVRDGNRVGGFAGVQVAGSSFLAGLTPVLNQAAGFVTSIGPQLAQMFRAALPYVGAWVQIFEGFASRTIPAVTAALQHFSRFLPDLVHLFNGLSDVIAYVIRTFGWLADKVGEFVQRYQLNFRKMMAWFDGTFMSWFRGLPDDLLHIGEQMIAGLLKGLESVPLVAPAIHIGNTILGALRGVLRAASPSMAMYDIGQNAVEGFRLGLANAGDLRMGGAITGPGYGGYGGGGGVVEHRIVLELHGAEGPFFEALKQSIRNRGGGGKNSVQIALGQTH